MATGAALRLRQQFRRVDANCATDRDIFGWVEEPGTGLVRGDESLAEAEPRSELGLRQAGRLARLDEQRQRGLVEIGIKRSHEVLQEIEGRGKHSEAACISHRRMRGAPPAEAPCCEIWL